MAKLTSVPTGDDAQPAKKAAKKAAKATAKKTAATGSSKAVEQQPDAIDLTEIDLLGQAVALDDVEDFINVCYYGKHGTGKTTNSTSMVNVCDGDVFIINAEGGLKKRALTSHGIDTSRLRLLPDPKSGMRLTFEYMEEVFWQTKDRLEKSPGSVGGFVWDSVTEIHQVILRNLVDKAVAEAERRGVDRDRWFKEQGDYGTMADQVTELIRRFRDLPCHFAMTALERRDVDKQSGKVAYNPAVTPALQTAMGGIPDLVGHCIVEEVSGTEQFVGNFSAAGVYSGKDRYRVLPMRLVDPTFARIHGYVTGTIDPDEDPVMVEAAKARAKRAGKRRSEELDDGTSGDDDE